MKTLSALVGLLSMARAIACEAPANINDDMIEPTEVALYITSAPGDLGMLQQAVSQFALAENLERTFERWDKTPTTNSIAVGYGTAVAKVTQGEMSRAIYLHDNLRTQCVRILFRAWDDCRGHEAQDLKRDLAAYLHSHFGSGGFPETTERACGVTL